MEYFHDEAWPCCGKPFRSRFLDFPIYDFYQFFHPFGLHESSSLRAGLIQVSLLLGDHLHRVRTFHRPWNQGRNASPVDLQTISIRTETVENLRGNEPRQCHHPAVLITGRSAIHLYTTIGIQGDGQCPRCERQWCCGRLLFRGESYYGNYEIWT